MGDLEQTAFLNLLGFLPMWIVHLAYNAKVYMGYNNLDKTQWI